MGKNQKISGFDDEVYISLDIESDGPIPGRNSMLSLGAAAYTAEGVLRGTFSVNLEELPEASPDERTMREFWDKNPEAWVAARTDPVDPHRGMQLFTEWVEIMKGSNARYAVAVAYPAGFDWTFVYWYLTAFVGSSPFSFACLDIKTLAMAVMNKHGYRSCSKRNMPKRWFSKTQSHTHVAVDDAKEQGEMFCNILKELRSKKR